MPGYNSWRMEEKEVLKTLMITRLVTIKMMGNIKTFKRRRRGVINKKIKMITMMIWMS